MKGSTAPTETAPRRARLKAGGGIAQAVGKVPGKSTKAPLSFAGDPQA